MNTAPKIGSPWGVASHGIVTEIEDLGKGYFLLTLKRSAKARVRRFTIVRDYDLAQQTKRWCGAISPLVYGYRRLELHVGNSTDGYFEFRVRFPDAALDPMLDMVRNHVQTYG